MRPAIRILASAAEAANFDRPEEVRELFCALIREVSNLDRSVSALLGYSEEKREPLNGSEMEAMRELARRYTDISMANRDGSIPLTELIKQKAVATLEGVPIEQVVRDMAGSMDQAAAQAHREGEPRRGRPASIRIQPGDMVQLGHGDDESLVSDGWYMVAEVRPVGSFTTTAHPKTGVGPERVTRWFRGEQ